VRLNKAEKQAAEIRRLTKEHETKRISSENKTDARKNLSDWEMGDYDMEMTEMPENGEGDSFELATSARMFLSGAKIVKDESTREWEYVVDGKRTFLYLAIAFYQIIVHL
jgi:hypothetical protein